MLRRWLPLVALALFAWLFGVIPWPWRGGWYSGEFTYRLQTDALLRGTMALQPVPHGLAHDWAWGRGAQQVWGLGMPLVRLPFEAVARLFGAFGFPDAVSFLIFYAAIILLVGGALRRRVWWEEAALLAATGLCPAFVNLCRTRFERYEEAVAGAFLVSLALGALVLRMQKIATGRNLFFVAALAGAAPLFRPTALAYGVVALGLALYLGRGLPRRTRGGAVLVFALVLSALPATNQARFGSPFEFGHRLNLQYNPGDQIRKHFGESWDHEPLGRASAELISALFLSKTANGDDFFRPGLLPFQSPTARFREFYFSTFTPWMAVALLAGWLTLLLRRPDVRVAALFSLGSFAAEFVFYLRHHGLTSRYIVDFGAAVAFAMVALLLAAFQLLGERRSILIAALFFSLTAWSISGAWFGPRRETRLRYTAAEAREKWVGPRFDGPAVPDHYRCGDRRQAITMLNGWPWEPAGGCLVQTETQLFLPTRECVHLRVGPLRGEAIVPGERTRLVRVKRGLDELVRIADVPAGPDRLLTFCAAPGTPTNPTGIEIVFIGWSDTADLPGPMHHLLEVWAQ